MTAYLVEHPPVVRQFKERGTTPSGLIVLHTAENTPDWVGPDAGAEAVARFLQERTTFGSYHELVDSDSIIDVVPFDLQAYGDGTGSNPFAIHVSAATQAAKWGQASPEWREETVKNMAAASARAARWLKAEHGITVPATVLTREQSEQRKPGFITHALRDPARRSDPGAGFPMGLFLQTFTDLLDPRPVTPNITAFLAAKNDDDRRKAARRIIRSADDAAVREAQRWLTNADRRDRAKVKLTEAKKALRALEVTK